MTRRRDEITRGDLKRKLAAPHVALPGESNKHSARSIACGAQAEGIGTNQRKVESRLCGLLSAREAWSSRYPRQKRSPEWLYLWEV
jgi:hypothetical protein